MTRREVARQTRMRESALAEIEAGRRGPTQEELASIARELETTASRLLAEGSLLAAMERAPDLVSLHAAENALRWPERFRSALIDTVRARALPMARPNSQEAPSERGLAEESWRRLQPLSPAARRKAIGGDPILAYPPFMRWGLAERLCRECEETLPHDPQAALGLAELALRVAECTGGDPAWQRHLQGYAWAFIAKARLAGGDRSGAEQATNKGRELWNPGCLEEPDFVKWPDLAGL